MKKINFQDFSVIVKFIGVVFVGIICVTLMFWFFLQGIHPAFLFLVFSALTLILALSMPAILFLWYYQGGKASHFRSNVSLNDEHTGIIVIVYNWRLFWKWFHVYLSGIDILIEGLQQTKKKILVYRCSNPIEVKKIVEQPQTIELWIIGHGQRDRINFGNAVLKYSELQDAPKKNRVVQLHCNHGEGKSLADYLCVNPINSFVTDNFRSWNENRRDIQNLITKFYG